MVEITLTAAGNGGGAVVVQSVVVNVTANGNPVELKAADFFGIVGISSYAPQALGELIPYLLTVFVSVALVSGVFRVIGRIVELLMDFRRW